MFPRALEQLVFDPELAGKMIFLAGPRQVGKTTLGKKWLGAKGLYYNWDDEKIRRDFRRDPRFFESDARQAGSQVKIIFDEIHKMSRWKSLLKGYYDTFHEDFRFLVTGSARLDLLQRSGDSLLGRYHLLHLFPLISHELEGKRVRIVLNPEDISRLEARPLSKDGLDALLSYSGFPDMAIRQSARSLNLWHREYRQRILREDLRDLTRITDLSRLEFLFDLLPSKVGSPLSLNSLREDLLCSHDAVRTMIEAMQKLAVVFLIPPYSRKIKHALSKEPKLYFYDWTRVSEAGGRFENFLAVQLKAYCEMITDGGWAQLDLFYVRDKQKREVDFLLVRDGKPLMLVEAKSGDTGDARSLSAFSRQLGAVPAFCVTSIPGVYKKLDDIGWRVSVHRFLNLLWQG